MTSCSCATTTSSRWQIEGGLAAQHPLARRRAVISGLTGGLIVNLLPYLCVPPNPKQLDYWDTIADRLFKIRHCVNIGISKGW